MRSSFLPKWGGVSIVRARARRCAGPLVDGRGEHVSSANDASREDAQHARGVQAGRLDKRAREALPRRHVAIRGIVRVRAARRPHRHESAQWLHVSAACGRALARQLMWHAQADEHGGERRVRRHARIQRRRTRGRRSCAIQWNECVAAHVHLFAHLPRHAVILLEAIDGHSLLRPHHMRELHRLVSDIQYTLKLDNGYGFFHECSTCLVLRPIELFTVRCASSQAFATKLPD